MDALYDLAIKPRRDNKLELLEDYKYKDVCVPKGFVTNGQDSPRWSWVLGFPPFKPEYAPAYVVHDYLLSIAKTEYEIRLANEYWAKIMLKIDSGKRVRTAVWFFEMYWEIKLF